MIKHKQAKFYLLFLATLGTVLSPSVYAAYNIYAKDGLSVDISGSVSAEYKKRSEKVNVNLKDYKYWWKSQDRKSPSVPTNKDFEETDRRGRLGLNSGSSWLEIRGTQRIDQDWRATADTQIGYYNGYQDDSLYIQAANVSLDRRNWGSVSIGKQYLMGGSIPRTQLFYPIDGWANSSIRADLTYVPNLQISVDHIFPSKDDVRVENNYSVVQGSNIGASYIYRIEPDHSVRFGLAYGNKKRNIQKDAIWAEKKSQAALASIEYKFKGLTLAADLSKEKLTLGRGKADRKSWGMKVAYDITPRFSLSTGYGQQKRKASLEQGYASLPTDHLVDDYDNFDKINENKYYAQAEYLFRENVKFYTRASFNQTKNYVGSELFTTLKSREINAGVSVTF